MPFCFFYGKIEPLFNKEKKMERAVLVDGCRTPFLKAGTIKNLRAADMAAVPVNCLKERYKQVFNLLDRVIGANIGNQILPPDGSNLTRVIQLKCGIPETVGAYTVNINCGSGLMAVIEAVKEIELGMSECVLVVATEVMSDYLAVYSRKQREVFANLNAASREKSAWNRIPKLIKFLVKRLMMRHKPEWVIKLGLTDPMLGSGMDKIANQIAKQYGISREEQDLFALESQRRAKAATLSGCLKREITPFDNLDTDNGIRFNQNLSALAKLPPTQKDGTITPGNASQVTDGAVAMLLVSDTFAKRYELPRLAEMSSKKTAIVGCSPAMMGIGPVGAVKQLLSRNEMNLSDIDVFESNEAFASVVLAQAKDLGLDMNRVNVNGGAIALGHPISASGARLVLTCAKELEHRNAKTGLVTLCVGGGQGVAALLER